MSYIVQNISGKVQSQPKNISHLSSIAPNANWTIGQVDEVDDECIGYYRSHTDAFAVLDGPNMDAFQTQVATANASTASTTLSAANIAAAVGASQVVLSMSGTLIAAGAATLPTAAALIAARPDLAIGGSYRLRVLNSGAGAFAWTMTTNTGWILVGGMVVAQNTGYDFIVTITSGTTATLQGLAATSV